MHSNEIRKKFYELALDGLAYKQIMSDLHISHSTVMRWRGRMGLKRRKRGKGAPCVKLCDGK